MSKTSRSMLSGLINDLEAVSPKNIISSFWKDSTLFEQVTIVNKNETFNVILSAVIIISLFPFSHMESLLKILKYVL